MIMLTFDEKELVTDLQRLSPPLRVAFAAACAERQMPAYETFVSRSRIQNPDVLRRALDDVWLDPTIRGQAELHRQLQACMAIIPQEDIVQPWTEGATYAQNAGMSVAYTLRARLSGEAQEAAWSARVAYESLDHFVINREDIDTNLPGGEAGVLSHPLLQAELARQRRDIDALRNVSGENLQQVIAQLRDRAKGESETFFTVEP